VLLTRCRDRRAGRKQKRVQRFGEGGERERYFADDDRADLATLVKRQKHAGGRTLQFKRHSES